MRTARGAHLQQIAEGGSTKSIAPRATIAAKRGALSVNLTIGRALDANSSPFLPPCSWPRACSSTRRGCFNARPDSGRHSLDERERFETDDRGEEIDAVIALGTHWRLLTGRMHHVCACGVCGATHGNRLLSGLRSDHFTDGSGQERERVRWSLFPEPARG